MGKKYPVGIVGESNYQPAIRACREGERVKLALEPGNPYDALAIAVVSSAGKTIGYIGRDSFLRDAVHDQGLTPSATIKSIDRASGGNLGVVLEVDLDGDEEPAERAFNRHDRSGDQSTNSGSGNELLYVIAAVVLLVAFIAWVR